jgi:hypothetical protein
MPSGSVSLPPWRQLRSGLLVLPVERRLVVNGGRVIWERPGDRDAPGGYNLAGPAAGSERAGPVLGASTVGIWLRQ